MQGGAWSLYISVDRDNTLEGSENFTCNTSTVSNGVANYMKNRIVVSVVIIEVMSRVK